MSEFNIRIADLESILTNCAGDHTPEEMADMQQELERLHKLEKVNDELQEVPVDRTEMTIMKPWRHYGAGTSVGEIDVYCMGDLGFSVAVDDNNRLTVGKLMELAPKPEPRVGKNGWTFDFVPCKIQPFRYGTCLAACCQCDDGYEVAYKFDYANNVLDVTLVKNDLSVFAKTIDMAKAGTSVPATLHEAESLATDAVTAYVTETDDINMMVPVFSRLRSWTDGNGKLQKLNRYSSHVYVSNYNHKVVHVDTDGKDGYDVLPGQKVLIKGSTVRTCHTVNTRHGKTRSQLIFIEHA